MTLEKKYTHFSLQNFSECWSGANVASSYNRYGKEDTFVPPEAGTTPNSWLGCMDPKKQKCPNGSLQCVGMVTTNYVYGLQNGEWQFSWFKDAGRHDDFSTVQPFTFYTLRRLVFAEFLDFSQ